jgi:hypothetical protein
VNYYGLGEKLLEAIGEMAKSMRNWYLIFTINNELLLLLSSNMSFLYSY